MKSNFAFLNDTFPVLGKFGELAEKYLYSDSNSCLMKAILARAFRGELGTNDPEEESAEALLRQIL